MTLSASQPQLPMVFVIERQKDILPQGWLVHRLTIQSDLGWLPTVHVLCQQKVHISLQIPYLYFVSSTFQPPCPHFRVCSACEKELFHQTASPSLTQPQWDCQDFVCCHNKPSIAGRDPAVTLFVPHWIVWLSLGGSFNVLLFIVCHLKRREDIFQYNKWFEN